MKTVFILFECDQWNSTESKRILAVCTGKKQAFDFAVHDAEINNDGMTEEQKKMLLETGQTQCADVNYLIEETTLNAYFN